MSMGMSAALRPVVRLPQLASRRRRAALGRAAARSPAPRRHAAVVRVRASSDTDSQKDESPTQRTNAGSLNQTAEAVGPSAANSQHDAQLDAAEAEAASLAESVDQFEVDDSEESVDVAPELDARALVTSVTTAVNERPLLRAAAFTGAFFLASTFLFSCYKVYLRFNSNRSKRRRQVGKNLVVVEALEKYLPDQRDRLSSAVIRALCVRTGFSRDSVFRKMMRFLLAERPFDSDALADVLALKDACGLSDAQVVQVLIDTAERSRKQTGVLMRKPTGMTAEGLARKAQGRALFSKLLFLCEQNSLLASPTDRDAAVAALCNTFGAVADDVEALRIANLNGITPDDLERLWGMPPGAFSSTSDDAKDGGSDE